MVREKGIDKDILAGVVEDVFSMMVRKRYGQEAKFEVVVNMDKGDIEIFLEREVVEVVEDPNRQIGLSTARELSGEELEIGEEYVEVIPMVTFGRRLVISAKQNLNQRIKEIERDLVYNEYSNAVGDIVVGEIYQIRRNEILINHNRNELVLPKSEQIPKERYKKGETIRAVVKEVRKNSGNPAVIVSRADTRFLAKLFELEIPEIYDGIIEIKSIAREPGERAKVAVESHDDRIDAVGACVGMKGVRIHTIVRELNNENIDVINYSDQPDVFVQRALAPAKILQLTLNAEAKTGDVLVAPDQVSLAIGRNGQNIRLAAKLTGYDLNLIKEGGDDDEYDIELVDFKEDLGEELYHKLISAGFDTAKEVLNAKMETLLAIEGLDEALINQTREMMQRDLEEAEVGEGEIEISRKASAENEDQPPAGQEDQAPAGQEDQAPAGQEDQAPAAHEDQAPAGQEEQVVAGEEAEKKQDQAADEPPKTGE